MELALGTEEKEEVVVVEKEGCYFAAARPRERICKGLKIYLAIINHIN